MPVSHIHSRRIQNAPFSFCVLLGGESVRVFREKSAANIFAVAQQKSLRCRPYLSLLSGRCRNTFSASYVYVYTRIEKQERNREKKIKAKQKTMRDRYSVVPAATAASINKTTKEKQKGVLTCAKWRLRVQLTAEPRTGKRRRSRQRQRRMQTGPHPNVATPGRLETQAGGGGEAIT